MGGSRLYAAKVHRNKLSSSIPSALAASTTVSLYQLNENDLSGLWGVPYLTCPLEKKQLAILSIYLVDVSDIFYFFCSGRGKGESEAPGGGGIGFSY